MPCPSAPYTPFKYALDATSKSTVTAANASSTTDATMPSTLPHFARSRRPAPAPASSAITVANAALKAIDRPGTSQKPKYA